VADIAIQCKRPIHLLIDSFDPVLASFSQTFFNNLRALRDAHKLHLTFLLATRQPLPALAGSETLREFEDLFAANQIWLSPLSHSDAQWTIERYMRRHNRTFQTQEIESILDLTGRHPGLLRALAAAWPEGQADQPESWLRHAGVQRECHLLWGDLPDEARTVVGSSPSASSTLLQAGLVDGDTLTIPIFAAFCVNRIESVLQFDRHSGRVTRGAVPIPEPLTAKEHALFSYLADHAGQVCEKDSLIQNVWAEDRVFEQGVRDESLAQLARRLRLKIEPDPSNPVHLLTVPGRGYRLVMSPESEAPAE
jgi:DNA-binding winged helix-turn-helix (wHTH) protein